MHVGLQVQRLRVQGKCRAEPAEVRRLVFTSLGVPHLNRPFEVLFAKRAPHAPREWPVAVNNRNFQASPDEEVLFVDDAQVGCEIAARFPLFRFSRENGRDLS